MGGYGVLCQLPYIVWRFEELCRDGFIFTSLASAVARYGGKCHWHCHAAVKALLWLPVAIITAHYCPEHAILRPLQSFGPS